LPEKYIVIHSGSTNWAGQIYTVYLNNNSSVLNKEKKATTLSRFEEGDKVRLYGAIREADELLIDAEVIRNMDL
jgi:hypothetical protein